MAESSADGTCKARHVRAQQSGRLQAWDSVRSVKFDDSHLWVGELTLEWKHIALASICLQGGGESFGVVLASFDHALFDFVELSLPMAPAAALLIQNLRQHVEITRISRALLVWPLRTLHPSLTFRQVYWWYQIFSNTMEVMFALTFFLTLGKRFSSSAEGMLSSLSKLRDDLASIWTGEFWALQWPILAAVNQALQEKVGGFVFLLTIPIQLGIILLDFHADFVILTMLLPHVFLLWHSISSLTYASQKSISLLLKLGTAVQSKVKSPDGKKDR